MIPTPPLDPILPAMSAAWDGDAVRAILNRAFRDRAVRSCEPYYIKYKPKRYCRVQYQVELENEDGANLQTQAHISLHPPRRAEKLAARNALPHGDGPHSRLRATYIPELAAIVQLFPVDLALTGLVEAASAEAMTPRIQRALGDRAGGVLEGCEVELVRYKAAKRVVLRYRLRGSRIPLVYGKIRSERSGALSRVTGTLARAGVPTPEPLAYLSDLGMFLQAEGAGIRLADLRNAAEYEGWMPAVAETLVRLHEAEIEDLPHYSPSAELTELRDAADTVGVLLPYLGTTSRSLVNLLATKLLEIDGDDLVPTHGSFHDDQVLVGDAGVTMIDLDGATMAHPLADVGHFLSYLSAEGASDAYERFLTGYLSARPGSADGHRVFEAASLLRWATLPFRELRENWPEAVESRVRLASARLREA